ncbi:D-alanyl-D-alanine carboxypeptidase [Trichothermofontia sp.]
MLQLFSSGLMSLWLQQAGFPARSFDLQSWQDTPGLVLTDEITPQTETLITTYLQGLSRKGMAPTQQGIWLQSGSMLLMNHQGTTPLPAASLTKVATSLAALETWGPYHRFTTIARATGPIANGILQGDLIIQGGGDPLFVWEEAIALGHSLNRLGIRQVRGDLVIAGDFWMNYETEPLLAGNFLRRALDDRLWDWEIETQYGVMPVGTPRSRVAIAGTVRLASAEPAGRPLLRHESLPLVQILKLMNVYSNNAIAEMVAASLGGGPTVVAPLAAQAAGVPIAEIQLINGSGLGQENQISPRAAAAMMMAVQRSLRPHGLTIADLMPVIGRDVGTAEGRKLPTHTAMKTGTLWDVSALTGVFPTQTHGLVWFTVINRGTDIDTLRAQQDQLVQGLARQWGAAPIPPAALTPHIWPNPDDQILGALGRNYALMPGRG